MSFTTLTTTTISSTSSSTTSTKTTTSTSSSSTSTSTTTSTTSSTSSSTSSSKFTYLIYSNFQLSKVRPKVLIISFLPDDDTEIVSYMKDTKSVHKYSLENCWIISKLIRFPSIFSKHRSNSALLCYIELQNCDKFTHFFKLSLQYLYFSKTRSVYYR